MYSNRSLVVILAILIILSVQVWAAVPNGAQVGSQHDNGRYPVPGPGTLSVTAGNITRANLEANMTTARWAGLYGNATGSLRLGDSSSYTLRTWNANGKMVYVSRVTPVWATLTNATISNVAGAFSYINGSAADNYTNTFSNGPENIGSAIFNINSDFAVTQSSGSTVWKTYSLSDGANVVFSGPVISRGTAYNGDVADYQMIIPENGLFGDETPTNWNVFLELV